MKRLIALILSLTIVLALAGCGKTTGDGEPVVGGGEPVAGGADMPTVGNDEVIETEQAQPAVTEDVAPTEIETIDYSLSDVAQIKYNEIYELLSGKDIQEIRDAWGEPVESDGKEDVWQLDESMLLMITYNDAGIVESCELICGTPLAPAE